MPQHIAHIALLVKGYDEAIEFYKEKLGFQLLEDTKLSDSKRWVLIAPPGAKECRLLLAKATDDKQQASIGNQTGGRVFLFLFTDDFWRDYNKMLDKNIHSSAPQNKKIMDWWLYLKTCTETSGTYYNPMKTIKA